MSWQFSRVCVTTYIGAWQTGRSILHIASHVGYIGALTCLVGAGADPNSVDDNVRVCDIERDPWLFFVLCVFRAVKKHGRGFRYVSQGFSPLLSACLVGNLEAAQWLVNHGAEVLLKDCVSGVVTVRCLVEFSASSLPLLTFKF